MDFLDKTFWEMEKACISMARQNENIWINYTLIKDDVEKLEKNNKELEEAVKAQSENETSGHTAQKHLDMQHVAKLCYKLNRSLCHFAKLSNNKVLLKSVDITLSAFFAGDENDTMIKFKTVLEAGRANLKDLAVYNITVANLDDLEVKINKVAAMPATINTIANNKKSATRGIKEIISDARVILDRLDDAFEGVIDDETFLEAWFDARKIKGRSANSKKKNNNGGQEKS